MSENRYALEYSGTQGHPDPPTGMVAIVDTLASHRVLAYVWPGVADWMIGRLNTSPTAASKVQQALMGESGLPHVGTWQCTLCGTPLRGPDGPQPCPARPGYEGPQRPERPEGAEGARLVKIQQDWNDQRPGDGPEGPTSDGWDDRDGPRAARQRPEDSQGLADAMDVVTRGLMRGGRGLLDPDEQGSLSCPNPYCDGESAWTGENARMARHRIACRHPGHPGSRGCAVE